MEAMAVALTVLLSRCTVCGAPTPHWPPCDCGAVASDASRHGRGAHVRLGGDTSAPQAQVDGAARSQASDQTLQQAVGLLPPDAQKALPRIIVATKRPDQVDPNAEGYTVLGYPAVYVAGWSQAYQQAMKGDQAAQMKLAGVLTHEAWHVANGADEAGAYRAEIEMLLQIGAPASVVLGVFRASQRFGRTRHPPIQ